MNISPVSMNIPTTLTPSVTPLANPEAAVKGGGKNFGQLLTDMVEQVDGLKKQADLEVQDIVTGRSTDIHQVSVKVQEAGIAFDLMLGVRNRLMDAYNELIKMAP